MCVQTNRGLHMYIHIYLAAVIGREDFLVFDDCASSFRSIANIARILLSVFGSSRWGVLGVGIIRSRSITFSVRQRGFGSSSLRCRAYSVSGLCTLLLVMLRSRMVFISSSWMTSLGMHHFSSVSSHTALPPFSTSSYKRAYCNGNGRGE